MMNEKNVWKGILAVVLLIMLTALCEFALGAEETEFKEVILPEIKVTDLGDNTDQAAAYINAKVYPAQGNRLRKIVSMTGSSLTGPTGRLYQAIAEAVPQIAAGTRTSTVIAIPVAELYDKITFTAEELGVKNIMSGGLITNEAKTAIQDVIYSVNCKSAVNCALQDFAMELYWFDKTQGYKYGGVGYQYSSYSITITGSYVVSMTVSANYAAGEYEVDPKYGTGVTAAIQNAQAIVQRYAGQGIYAQLKGFKDEICAQTAYNTAAAQDSSTPYGDPWQLIWVFDGDDATNVVCEGYAKAFDYLCQLSSTSFKEMRMSGIMSGGTGSGGHMWNMVNINGLWYLVDVTNCDEGTIGYPDELFMAGYTSVSGNAYIYTANGRNIAYTFDTDLVDLYSLETEDMANGEHEHQFDTYGICQICGENGEPSLSFTLSVIGLDNDWNAGEEQTVHWCIPEETNMVTRINFTVEYEDENGLNNRELSAATTEEIEAGEGDLSITVPAASRGWITAAVSWSIAQYTGSYTTRSEEEFHGHGWLEPAYTWSESFETVKAERFCKFDSSHVETETVNVTPEITLAATCEEPGETTYTSAAFENEAFAVQIRKEINIPALGHDWNENLYVWTEENTYVTASRICGRNASHMESETVNAASEITRAATCEEPGETTYTSAAYENGAFEVQTKTEANIPALGHNWNSASYIWSSDNKTVTANHTCERDSSHAETETVAAVENVIRAATCEEGGIFVYSSEEFTNDAFVQQTKEPEVSPALGHDWDVPIYNWNDELNAATASRSCKRDSSHVETETTEEVIKSLYAAPSETEKGKIAYAALFENPAFSGQVAIVNEIPCLNDMKVLYLPNDLTKIEEEAFAGLACEAVIVPDGCKVIGSKAFANCRNMIYVRIPAGVTNIANDAFEGCEQALIDRDNSSSAVSR